MFDFLQFEYGVDFLVFIMLGVVSFLELWFGSVINFEKFSVICTSNVSAVPVSLSLLLKFPLRVC